MKQKVCSVDNDYYSEETIMREALSLCHFNSITTDSLPPKIPAPSNAGGRESPLISSNLSPFTPGDQPLLPLGCAQVKGPHLVKRPRPPSALAPPTICETPEQLKPAARLECPSIGQLDFGEEDRHRIQEVGFKIRAGGVLLPDYITFKFFGVWHIWSDFALWKEVSPDSGPQTGVTFLWRNGHRYVRVENVEPYC